METWTNTAPLDGTVGTSPPDGIVDTAPPAGTVDTSHPAGIVAIFVVGVVNLGGWLFGWSVPVRVATLVIIAFVALVTLRR